MITGELKSKVDSIWDTMWSGGISNPLTVIEQLTYLLFIKRLDELHILAEHKANRLDKPIEQPIFSKDQEQLRWSRFKETAPEQMFLTVKDEVFPFIKTLGNGETSAEEKENRQEESPSHLVQVAESDVAYKHAYQEESVAEEDKTEKEVWKKDSTDSTYAHHMRDALFMIPTPRVLANVVDQLAGIEMADTDTKGDLYEYMLGKIASAGQNGQFRTPRHIIRLMVDMCAPTPRDLICDPACGTAGFLIAASEYLQQHHSSEIYQSEASRRRFNQLDEEKYSLLLANPPFAGSLDYESIAKDLQQVVKTKKTELLFLALFLRLLRTGGRAAVIVPDGVLFGSSKAHKTLRKILVEEQKLDAIISMPSGVFKPYAGVSTTILFFTKTNSGGTDQVWFYDMRSDGFSLDDKRSPQPDKSNLPDILARWQDFQAGCTAEAKRKRTEQSFLVPKEEIAGNDYDLSINRYKEVVYEAVEYDPPGVILGRLAALEQEIAAGRVALEGLLGEKAIHA
ncbi:MAG: class I SAM-dependent DNA methyltransferase [Candidatus Electrothrix sp. GW3-4]|uniref:type I restriction-modification system subunit M n=1 Tax=Candidatus Electrothrix sp. GW3-4 TaxID=3126740 RepID=UPI0030CB7087